MRLSLDQRVRLQLKPPAGRTLALGAVLLLVLLLGLEFAARSFRPAIPFQAYGANHVQFEYQWQTLQEYVDKNGPPNCFILGNSQSLRGIDPVVFSQAIAGQSGEKLQCYNFSVVGTNISTTYLFSQILIDKYHPRVIILGANFLDYTEERENRWDARFEENPWIDYQLGSLAPEGWLIEHSAAYRLLQLLSYGAPNGMDFSLVRQDLQKWQSQLTPSGYGFSKRVENLAEKPKPGFTNNFVEQFGDFSLSQWNLYSLEQMIVIAQENGVTFIIVETPYHESLLTLEDEEGAPHPKASQIVTFIDRVNQDISAIAERHGVIYIKTGPLDFIPEDGWHDRYHLNAAGSPIFSRWLAEQILAAIQSGQLNLPDHGG